MTDAGCGDVDGIEARRVAADTAHHHLVAFVQGNCVRTAERQLGGLQLAQDAVLRVDVIVRLCIVAGHDLIAVPRRDEVATEAAEHYLAAAARADDVIAALIAQLGLGLQHQVAVIGRTDGRCAVNFAVIADQDIFAENRARGQLLQHGIVGSSADQNRVATHTSHHQIDADLTRGQCRGDLDEVAATGSRLSIQRHQVGHGAGGVKVDLCIVAGHRPPAASAPLVYAARHGGNAGYGDWPDSFPEIVGKNVDDIAAKAANYQLEAVFQRDRVVSALVYRDGLHPAQDASVGRIEVDLAVVTDNQVVTIARGNRVVAHSTKDHLAAVGDDDLVGASRGIGCLSALYLQHQIGRRRCRNRIRARDLAVVAENRVLAARQTAGNRTRRIDRPRNNERICAHAAQNEIGAEMAGC